MRDFRFRAWHKDAREMLQSRDQGYQGNVFAWLAEGQPVEIMQYTDFHEAYEGDIIKISGIGYYSNGSFSIDEEEWEFIGKVELNSFMWLAAQNDGTYFPFVDLISEGDFGVEIIGNIYESPELLEN